MPGFITLSTNTNCLNKDRGPYVEGQPDLNENTSWRRFHGLIDDGAIERLMLDVIMKGHAINASPFEGSARKNCYSIGGNIVIIDLDDGIPRAVILNSYTYRMWGCFYYPSCSSGVTSTKKGVDGRDRGRVAFRVGREFNTFTELDENGKPPTDARRNLERISVATFLADSLCSDVGIPKLQDNCHQAVSQLWYGNSGSGIITYATEDADGNLIEGTYTCSTDRAYDINRDGCLPAEDVDRIVEAYKERKPEILLPRRVRTDDELDKEVNLARWILNNDLLSEDQLTVYTTAVTNVGGACKAICESLEDDWLATMERFDDGHPWRLQHKLMGSWDRLDAGYERCIGSLINLADEASPGWRAECPYMGSGAGRKFPPIPLSECFLKLKSTNPINIII